MSTAPHAQGPLTTEPLCHNPKCHKQFHFIAKEPFDRSNYIEYVFC